MQESVRTVSISKRKGHSLPYSIKRNDKLSSLVLKENKIQEIPKRKSLPANTQLLVSPDRRRRKNQVENLQSNLSPKYIGIVESSGKRSRYGRQQKYKEDEDFLPTQIACYVRRSPTKLKFISPNSIFDKKSVPYESPIEKLIEKNRLMASRVNDEYQKIDIDDISEKHNIKKSRVLIEEFEIDREPIENNIKSLAAEEEEVEDIKLIPYPADDTSFNLENNIDYLTLFKSPSSHSTDSAKGSSIDLEMDYPIKTGDIFWGRISPFPYWPCIVWPDPTGRTILLNSNKIQNVKIHVRFFADNGRRSWVKKSNMFPFNGKLDFEKRSVDILEKYGKKHVIYRAFDINSKKKRLWEQAVCEADRIIVQPLENRSIEFEKLVQLSRELMASERLTRRKSMSDIQRTNFLLYDSYTVCNFPIKRERIPDNSLDNLKIKRAKIEGNDSFEYQTTDSDIKTNLILEVNDAIFNDIEFKKFYDLIKEYVFSAENKDLEKYLDSSVKNIWYLRHLAKKDKTDTTNGKILSTQMTIRKLSNRIKQSFIEKAASVDEKLNIKEKTVNKSMSSKRKKPKAIEEVVEDIVKLNKNYLFRGLNREPVCKICKSSTNLIKCAGTCQSWIHKDCANIRYSDSRHVTGDSEDDQKAQGTSKDVFCLECTFGEKPKCFVCKKNDDELGEIIKCYIHWCGQYYHKKCLRYWPQSKVTRSATKVESLLCPGHVCHTCVSDDPRSKFLQMDKTKLTKCIECPATYHLDSFCIPAGTKFLTATQIICPRHAKNEEKKVNINANWCFICASGGSLICCETCPTAFHLECLKIPQSDENYICEECETGRLPLYGELVWAKLGPYRWWPSLIIPPPEVPRNLLDKEHKTNEFCVRFFGSNNHTWISRSRVFLYQEGDWGKVNKTKGIDQTYRLGLEEARRTSELFKFKKQSKTSNMKDRCLTPLPYAKIKTNRPVPPVKLQEVDLNDLTPCDCSGKDVSPCGPYSGCLNRLLMTECNPKICPAGENCLNQMFEKREYPPLKVYWTSGKGWGLICEEDIPVGTFIIEYVGEIIDDTEFKRRIAEKTEEKDENYYFLTLEKDYMIDAGPKGNLARFMNHSCDPNCETQKWTVNGVTRIGLFAIKDIAANIELTFNYNLECLGDNKKICHCGAEKCAGFIGAKFKEPEKVKTKKELKKTSKKRPYQRSN